MRPLMQPALTEPPLSLTRQVPDAQGAPEHTEPTERPGTYLPPAPRQEPSIRDALRRPAPRRVRRQVVGLPLRLPLSLHPLLVVLDLPVDAVTVPTEHRRHQF